MPKPNIIFILIDDLGWADLSGYGSRFYETPNLDGLIREGICYSDAYASCPVCSPTRASVMTGKYPARVGVTNFIGGFNSGKLLEAKYTDHLPLTEKSLASALKEGGYATWHIGKWHLGEENYFPERHGFDINIGGCGMGNPGHDGYFPPYHVPVTAKSDKEYLTDRLTDDACGLIKKRDKDKPFFLNLWHYAVHTPIMAKEDDIKYFEQKARRMGIDKIYPFVEDTPHPSYNYKGQYIKKRLIQSDPVYAAMLYNLDMNVGKILKTLREQNIEDDTIVIFTSDNGGESSAGGSPTSNKPLCEGKGWMYEGGVRVPLIIKWNNKIAANTVSDTPVVTMDFYPTLLKAAGLDYDTEQHADGLDMFAPGFDYIKRPLFWHFPHYANQGGTPACSVRSGDYKLIRFFEDERFELYDLKNDLSETEDFSKKQPERVKELNGLLSEWLADVCAKFPSANPEWKAEDYIVRI